MTDIVERLRAAAYADEKDAKRHDEALATAPGGYASDFRQWRDEELASAALAREAAAEIERLREMVRQFVDMHDDAVSNPAGGPSLGGLMDARDNDGAVYQSQALANLIFRARAAQMDGEG